MDQTDWERRIAAAWASFDELSETDFLALIEKLAAELPTDSGVGWFERASSLDATDHPDMAITLYEQALERGLPAGRRRQAVIQLASSLRLAGRAPESAALLAAELDGTSDDLNDAVVAFLALALADMGQEREAAAAALAALAPHLSQYQVSVANYARQLAEPGKASGSPG
ncbi:MAG TPA: tetratricopeptide repeat protein [Streptosporangiaceae bacterium]